MFRGRRFDSGVRLSIFYSVLFCLMSYDEIDNANSEQSLSDASNYVWQYFAKQSVESSVLVSKSGSKEMDKASFFYENSISFNVADSSSFARMIEENMRFAKQNPFQSYKAPSLKQLSKELLDQADKSTEQLVVPILAIDKKFGTTISSYG